MCALIYSLNRAKKVRHEASERVKEVYKRLRQSRSDQKDVSDLMDEIKRKAYLLPEEQKRNALRLKDMLQRQHVHSSRVRAMPVCK
jgi:hypothetical protein